MVVTAPASLLNDNDLHCDVSLKTHLASPVPTPRHGNSNPVTFPPSPSVSDWS